MARGLFIAVVVVLLAVSVSARSLDKLKAKAAIDISASAKGSGSPVVANYAAGTSTSYTFYDGCYTDDWGLSFDNAGWSYAGQNRLLTGIYRSTCDYIYCWESTQSCGVKNVWVSDNTTVTSWGSSFDSAGWSTCTAPYFLAGFYRSGGGGDQYLHNIETAFCRKAPAWTAYGDCQNVDVTSPLDSQGWVNCPADYYLVGLYRSGSMNAGDDLLHNIETLKCCKPQVVFTCGVGQYVSGESSCSSCPVNTYQTSAYTTATSCTACATNYYTRATGQSACIPAETQLTKLWENVAPTSANIGGKTLTTSGGAVTCWIHWTSQASASCQTATLTIGSSSWSFQRCPYVTGEQWSDQVEWVPSRGVYSVAFDYGGFTAGAADRSTLQCLEVQP
jgi:hypothetical protein